MTLFPHFKHKVIFLYIDKKNIEKQIRTKYGVKEFCPFSGFEPVVDLSLFCVDVGEGDVVLKKRKGEYN